MSKKEPAEKIPSRPGPGGWLRIRNYFLTGVVVAGPIGITLYLTYTIIGWVDSWVKPFIPRFYNPETYLPFAVPGLGLLVSFLGLVLLGFLTAGLAGKTIIRFGENLLNRMPFVRNLYRGLKQIFETVLSQRGRSFQKAGLIEYPRRGLYAIVFLATDTTGEVLDRLPEDDEFLSVFLPTTPNPTSGFLLFVKRDEITMLDMSVEEAATLVISAGLVSPEYQQKTRELAEQTRPEKPDDEPDEREKVDEKVG